MLPKSAAAYMIPDFLCQASLCMATNFSLELRGCISSATSPQSQNHCTPSHTGKPSKKSSQGKTVEANISPCVSDFPTELSPGKANCHFKSQPPLPSAAMRVWRVQFIGKLWTTLSPYNTLPSQAARPDSTAHVIIKGGTSGMPLLPPDP